MAYTDRFNYSGVEVPPGGLPFQALVKVAAANLDKRQLDFEWEINGMLNK